MTYPEKIWQGRGFVQQRIFVLAESWYGDYSDELVTDDGYILAYLAGRVVDAMYTRIANACQLSRQDSGMGSCSRTLSSAWEQHVISDQRGNNTMQLVLGSRGF